MRDDLIETHEILSGLDRENAERMFPLVGETGTRGQGLKIRSLSFQRMKRITFYP